MPSKFTYTGDRPQTYPQYLDAAEGRTLHAEPGHTYEIAPVDGLVAPGPDDEDGNPTTVPVKLPVPPADGRWTKPTRSESKES